MVVHDESNPKTRWPVLVGIPEAVSFCLACRRLRRRGISRAESGRQAIACMRRQQKCLAVRFRCRKGGAA
jgi:hypothetical protein